jgi:hypothetical protein
VLDADGFALVARRFTLGAGEQVHHPRAHVRHAARLLRQPFHGRFGEVQHLGGIGPRASEDLGDAPIPIDRARHEMQRQDLRVLSLVGELLGSRDEVFRFGDVAIQMDHVFLVGHGGPKGTRADGPCATHRHAQGSRPP